VRVFFFEKKEEKNFYPLGLATIVKNFFGSFFQKRRLFDFT